MFPFFQKTTRKWQWPVGHLWVMVLPLGLFRLASAEDPGNPLSLEKARQRAAAASPLDKLSASAIPKLERFDWQPKELAAVLGEHRGRQGSQGICVTFTPDGKQLASGGANGIIRFSGPSHDKVRDGYDFHNRGR